MRSENRTRLSLILTFVLTLTMSSGGAASAASGGPATTGPASLSEPRQGDAAQIALDHLKRHRQDLGLSAADVADVVVTDSYVSEHTGVSHVHLRQRFDGIEVVGANLNVTVASDGTVAAMAGEFVPNLHAAVRGRAPGRDAEASVRRAATQLGLAAPSDLRVKQRRGGQAREVVFAESGISQEPIPARLVYQPLGGQLRLAWQIELYETDGDHWWNLRVDAQTGQILARDDYVSDATYNVYPIPGENPDDGPRMLLTDPHSTDASPFGWHDTDGAAGAEFTVTRGNNVHAYTDRDADNLPDPGSDPDGGPGLVFDFPLDLNEAPATYSDAAVTNLFYWNNIVHDVFHGYGFDEASGNFQVNNYGNGGMGGDDVRAEAQDGSGRNNANFATPPDGFRPRMQMFEWRSALPNTVLVNAPPAIAGSEFEAPIAGFGPSLVDTGNITGDVVYIGQGCDPAYGGAGVPLDPYLDDPSGKIALIDRGACTFTSKVHKAEDQGAVAVIVANSVPGDPIAMGGSDPDITIVSVMVSLDDGNTLKASLTGLNVTLIDGTGGAPDRDSDLDAGVIVHEYGHGISNRLTGGPSTTSCLSTTSVPEQMGEGWSDWLALTLTANPADAATTSRGIGNYVVFEGPDGAGIRPAPYTTDLSVNDYTYGRLATDTPTGALTIPHGVGFVWSSMIWEVYWNLVDKHGFNPDVYDDWTSGGNNLAIQLVIDGMKLQPCGPGFVDGRDAILLADQLLTFGANQCEIWEGFAKRGLGYSADQGSSGSTTDGVEAFDLPPTCTDFSGFLGPVNDPPQLNSARGGSTVSLIFSLSGDQGLDIFAAGYPQSGSIDCDTKAATGPLEPTMTPGGSGLSYNPSSDRYTYKWKTLSGWAGTCRALVMQFADGTNMVAYFRFR